MVNKENKKNNQSVDANAPQEDPKNYVTQTSRHPQGHLVTGEETTPPPIVIDNVENEGDQNNVTK